MPHEKGEEVDLAALIAQAQQGEEEAFAEICRRFAGLVKKYAFQQHLRPIADEAQAHGWLAIPGYPSR